MAYCKKCGTELNDYAERCQECGALQMAKHSASVNDQGGFLWGLLGFCLPIVGLILFLIWREERPLTAKAVGMGALVSVIINVVFSIIYIAMAGAAFATL